MVLIRPLALLLTALLALPAAPAVPLLPEDGSDLDARVAKAPLGEAKRYRVRAVGAHDLQLPAPTLPALAGYTAEAVAAKIQRKPLGQVRLRRMVDEITLKEFVGSGGRLREWAARQSSNPQVIVLEQGYLTPAGLARRLPKSQFEETAPGVYLLRMPLLIAKGATLHVDATVKQLRLSEERGAFVVNSGQLFLTDTQLTAWRERENGPASFRDGAKFRPFITAWGGSQTYIVNSRVASLGYAESKSYGVSISQYSPSIVKQMAQPRPTGWLLNSEFVDLWYGFYCYEADDVVLLGNTYRDNIVYGIDPHDRSQRLVIARNVVHGTRKKHGIIVSREVNDSWVFENRSYDNHLSGIVVDRSSERNVVANNIVSNNGTDGITIYESADNLIWRNRAVANRRHGLRLRNSTDIRLYGNEATANGLAGIYGHIKDLSGTDRDMRLDPFDPNVSMVVVGGALTYNGSGPVTIDQPLSVELYDVQMLAPRNGNGIQMTGVLGQHQSQVLDILMRQKQAVVIEPDDVVRVADRQ
ncbi:MAG: mannuronan 5-epimerase AlgG [Stagnimonas sp.]|nr:mannuronan 5-epimerase AlgG [Stagnimonas sp.]